MHIRDIDLNLMKVFDAVYRLRSVTRAADALGLTQSAVSHSLSRLRTILKSPLFLRVPSGVEPTPKADRFAAAVQLALSTLERAVEEAEQFDPAHSSRVFRLHLNDLGECSFLPRLARELEQQGPHMSLESFQFPPAEVETALNEGKIHYAIGYLPQLTDGPSTRLMADHYGFIVRAGHPVLQRLNANTVAPEAALRRLEYVVSKSHPDSARLLEELGSADRVRMTTLQFAGVPEIVRHTDWAGIVPLRASQALGALNGCTVLDSSLAPVDCDIALHWSRRFEADAARRWLHDRLLALFAVPDTVLRQTR